MRPTVENNRLTEEESLKSEESKRKKKFRFLHIYEQKEQRNIIHELHGVSTTFEEILHRTK